MILDVLINSMFSSKMTDSRPSELVQVTGKSFCDYTHTMSCKAAAKRILLMDCLSRCYVLPGIDAAHDQSQFLFHFIFLFTFILPKI